MPHNHAIRYSDKSAEAPRVPADILQEILRAIDGIEYGSVEIVIHNSKVIQIEIRTKKRFDGESRPAR